MFIWSLTSPSVSVYILPAKTGRFELFKQRKQARNTNPTIESIVFASNKAELQFPIREMRETLIAASQTYCWHQTISLCFQPEPISSRSRYKTDNENLQNSNGSGWSCLFGLPVFLKSVDLLELDRIATPFSLYAHVYFLNKANPGPRFIRNVESSFSVLQKSNVGKHFPWACGGHSTYSFRFVDVSVNKIRPPFPVFPPDRPAAVFPHRLGIDSITQVFAEKLGSQMHLDGCSPRFRTT